MPSLVLTGLTIAPIVLIPGMIPSKQSIVGTDPDHQFNCYDLVGTRIAVQGQVVECAVICKRMRRCGWWMVDGGSSPLSSLPSGCHPKVDNEV